ncbi:hypothetical protein [Erwinia amylovora]
MADGSDDKRCQFCSVPIFSHKPVSYTHLDVYKRQGLRLPPAMADGSDDKRCQFCSVPIFSHKPVSYTHLDVYKRQVYG